MDYKFKITSRKREVLEAKNAAIERTLEACGIQAEAYAKRNLTQSGHVDTGLLRNSITHAVSEKPPAISSYESNSTHNTNPATTAWGTAGKPVDPVVKGKYEGSAPAETAANRKAVYIGTNVEYGVYIEEGTSRLAPTHYLKNAVTQNVKTYNAIAKKYLSGK